MSPLPLGFCDPSTIRLQVEPLDEADIIAGEPIVRYAALERVANGSAVGLRDFSAGRFTRRHATDEVLHVVEGGATVIDGSQRVWALREGDIVTFRQGSAATWQVPEYMRALAFTCQPAAPASRRFGLARNWGALAIGLVLGGALTATTVGAAILGG